MGPLHLGLLGNPVAHSRSPEIHGAMLELTGLEGSYRTVLADEAKFAETISEIRAGDWDGLNVTMPHKALAASSCDEISDVARTSRSVNTLYVRDGRLMGESTDTTATITLLTDGRFDPGAPILLLGAGGGAAAVLAGIGDRRFHVAARRSEAAEALASRFGGDVTGWGTPVPDAIVINSTPLGMSGEQLPDGILETASGLIDLAYSRQDTPAVTTARQLGLTAVDGYEFLVRQAIDSFAIWTGARVPYETLMQRLRKA